MEALAGVVCWHCFKEVDLIAEYEKEVHDAVKRLRGRVSGSLPLLNNKVDNVPLDDDIAASEKDCNVLEEDITPQDLGADWAEDEERMDANCLEEAAEWNDPLEATSDEEDIEVEKSDRDGGIFYVGKTYAKLETFEKDYKEYCVSTNTVARKVNAKQHNV